MKSDGILSWFTANARPTASHVDGAGTVSRSQVIGWYLRKGLLPGIRGTLRVLSLGRSGFPVFIGRGVSVAYPKFLHLGKYSLIGDRSKVMALSVDGIWIGKRVTIRENAWIQSAAHPANPGTGLRIGDDTYIGPSAILGVGGRVDIGARCQIGAAVVIVSENHALEDGLPSPSKVTREGVTIGDGCWLGHRVTVLDGVTLGAGCVVGAGAVVTKSFPAGSRLAGVPARLL